MFAYRSFVFLCVRCSIPVFVCACLCVRGSTTLIFPRLRAENCSLRNMRLFSKAIHQWRVQRTTQDKSLSWSSKKQTKSRLQSIIHWICENRNVSSYLESTAAAGSEKSVKKTYCVIKQNCAFSQTVHVEDSSHLKQ